MDALFLFLLVGATSALALHLERRRGRAVDRGVLRAAVGRVLECVGLAALFLAANTALGMLLTIAIRGLTPVFISLYISSDASLIVLSFLQAIAFQRWRGGARPE
jgi:hypothetical protein